MIWIVVIFIFYFSHLNNNPENAIHPDVWRFIWLWVDTPCIKSRKKP
ncbi:hypothetical protein CES85_0926 [Ochrobactrum quorumnocens]|uniref:Uncharacterized protein n=1 Tax=Ochrobactrum quorumnocens TaxID=271865 RepID=A0A248UH65_9HYPH|nr:hypothetical protein CES85_0926 [[Ochrobactrum] quorumnocens]